MITLGDILDYEALVRMQVAKRINVQTHPTLPLSIYNYSNMAQFTNEWTHEERVCRGLIVDFDHNVIARGPSKFFNYGQPGAPEVSMETQVAVTTKEDGSLGIGWMYDYRGVQIVGVATRGSFVSEQAQHATDLLSEEDVDLIRESRSHSHSRIWEVVYPANRIVLDYKGLDKLMPLGTVDNVSGLITTRPNDSYSVLSFSDAVSLRIPDDQEGYVLDLLDDNGATTGHLKLKGDRYKELHGAIFGLSERKIWESMGRGEDMEEFVAALPDELQPWADGVINSLDRQYRDYRNDISDAFVSLRLHFGVDDLQSVPRGDIARYIMSNFKDISGPVFSLLDNKDEAVAEWVHKQIKPEHRLFRVDNQDVN